MTFGTSGGRKSGTPNRLKRTEIRKLARDVYSAALSKGITSPQLARELSRRDAAGKQELITELTSGPSKPSSRHRRKRHVDHCMYFGGKSSKRADKKGWGL